MYLAVGGTGEEHRAAESIHIGIRVATIRDEVPESILLQ